MTAFTVDTELGRLHVEARAGRDRSRPPVLLWHSMFVDSRSWGRLVPLLGDRDVFLVDGPSSGQSEPLRAPADIPACARAAASIVETVGARTGARDVDWVGTAWGGHVGMELAATRPDLVRSLVAISAPTFPVPPALRAKVRVLLPLYRLVGPRGPVRSAIVETLFTDATRRDDPDAVALLDDSLRGSGRAMVAAVQTAILNRTDLLTAATRITCPTLLVATDDRGEWTGGQAQEAAEVMRDARVVTIPAARVIPALEQPRATADAIMGFWAEVAGRVSPSP
ncbi:alpha/beta fold hydrolase [Williamsia serinedens]|uniref:Pimeloyl-ACP methyl ester carboxylesterase n=1 Tax=Williamsia serinedens TaxID=391736 RepID=A0ABT1GX09_9NOCA|nr:alpha/beta hydrolase [Williamsia serinedens]MCP2159515.1 Pimeloyl-ACP methyl ester carboxylesterase [Williamsia serinedens]